MIAINQNSDHSKLYFNASINEPCVKKSVWYKNKLLYSNVKKKQPTRVLEREMEFHSIYDLKKKNEKKHIQIK